MALIVIVPLLLLLPGTAAGAATYNPQRSFMAWMLADADATPAAWAARIANLKAHAQNMTAVSPCIYDIGADGTFAKGTGSRPYAQLYPHMKDIQAMGVEVIPLIAGPPNLAGQRALTSDNGARFIKEAVAEAVANKWTGYNFDNELRGKFTDESWKFLEGYGGPWMKFLNTFADAMHAENKTLSVFIGGCCGWVDPLHDPAHDPEHAVGHCNGDKDGKPIAFSSHEFVGTTCPQYAASRLDRVYAGSSYGLPINGPNPNPRLNRSSVTVLKELTNASRTALTWEKYATGIKGGFPYCSNGSIPSTCIFDDEAKQTIDWLGQELGTNHIANWVNEPSSQAEWDAWGYFLQGRSPPPPPPSPLPPPPPPRPPGKCKIVVHHTLGCFDYSKWKNGTTGPVLPRFEAAVEGKISLESCALSCHGARSVPGSVAGVLGGAHCFCGATADLTTTAAKTLSRPKSECIVPTTPCDGDKHEKECGGSGRMLAYAFTCDL